MPDPYYGGPQGFEHVADISSLVAVNRSSLKLKPALRPLLEALARAAAS